MTNPFEVSPAPNPFEEESSNPFEEDDDEICIPQLDDELGEFNKRVGKGFLKISGFPYRGHLCLRVFFIFRL